MIVSDTFSCVTIFILTREAGTHCVQYGFAFIGFLTEHLWPYRSLVYVHATIRAQQACHINGDEIIFICVILTVLMIGLLYQ